TTNRTCRAATSQTRTVLSRPPAASSAPSGEKARHVTPAVWPARVACSRGMAASHKRTVWSSPPVASRAPRGANAAARTGPRPPPPGPAPGPKVVPRERLPAGPGPQRLPHRRVDPVADVAHATVGEEEVDPLGVAAGEVVHVVGRVVRRVAFRRRAGVAQAEH